MLSKKCVCFVCLIDVTTFECFERDKPIVKKNNKPAHTQNKEDFDLNDEEIRKTHVSTTTDTTKPLLLVVDGRQVGHVRDRHGRSPVDAVAIVSRWIDRIAKLVLPFQRIPARTSTQTRLTTWIGEKREKKNITNTSQLNMSAVENTTIAD